MENADRKTFDNSWLINLADQVYKKSLDGVPHVMRPLNVMCNDYLKEAKGDKKLAIKNMIKNQQLKGISTNILIGLGELPIPLKGITIPAEIGNTLYVQARIVNAIATICGYDCNSDQVKTLAYCAIAGLSVSSVFKKYGIEITKKISTKLIEELPNAALKQITKVMGFKLVSKTVGTKSIIQLPKIIPFVGQFFGAGVDYLDTKLIADRAFKIFYEGNDINDDKVVDISTIDSNEIVFEME